MICLHTAIQLDVLMSERGSAHTQHTGTNWRPHIYLMRNDSSKCYFRTRLKTTFSITIKTSLFNLIWKVFFARSRSRSLLPITPFAASLHRFGIVILWFGVSLSQFNLLSICLCRFDVCVFSLSIFVFSCACPFFYLYFFLVVHVCAYVCIHSQGLERSLMKTCN